MAPEPTDPLLGAVILLLAIASLGTWFFLADRLRHGPILRYEPRRPVPWHGAWTMLPILMVLVVVYAVIAGGDSPVDVSANAANDLVQRLALGSVQQMALVVAFLAVMIGVSRANRTDLGLPKNVREFAGDLRIGVIGWLAALVPVFGMQWLLIKLFGEAKGHPIIKMVEENASPTLFALAFAAAVVVAPFCEELLFRLVLQGWLEKWEDGRLGLREEMTNEEASESDNSSFEICHPKFSEGSPPQTGLLGLPHGSLPIGISSLLFALAHLGWGPDPVALFLLALILGYVYQRTHRILPSMVIHALFNGMTLFMLWRVTSVAAP